jgi:hypothetical protein
MRLPRCRSIGSVRWRAVVLGMATSPLFACLPAHAADTQSTWINAVSANWTTSGDWSNTTTYPQNGSKKYQATINQNGSAAYSVLVNSTIAVDSLTINAANATLLLENPGTLTLQSLNLMAGSVNVMGGTLAAATGGGTLTVAAGATFETSFGTISGTNAIPTLSGVNIASGSQVNIATGSTLNYSGVNSGTIAGSNATLNLQGNMTLASFGTLNLTGSSLVDVSGTVAMQSTDVFSPGTSTLPWNLNGGTITGGTLAITSAQNFSITSGTLSGVTVQGLGLIGTSNLHGLTFTGDFDGGGQTLDATSRDWDLQFTASSPQVTNATITNANGPTQNYDDIGVTSTLSIASSTNVQATGGGISFQGGSTVNNYGNLTASGANSSIGAQFLSVFNNYANVSATNGSTANFSVGDLYNTGSITANQGTLTFDCYLGNNAGGSVVASNQSTVVFGGSFSNFGTFTLDDSTASLYSQWYNGPSATINIQNGAVLTLGDTARQGGTLHLRAARSICWPE